MTRLLAERPWLASALQLARGPIAGSALLNAGYRVANILLGFVTVMLLGRTLGVDGFGVFTFGLGVAALIASILQSGLETFLIRFVAQYAATHDWPLLNGAVRFALLLTLVAAVLVYASAGVAVAAGIADSPLARASLIGAAIAPVMAINTVGAAILRGLRHSGRAYFPQLILTQAVHLGLIVVFVLRGGLTPDIALISLAFGWLVATSLSWIWVGGRWPTQAKTAGALFQFKAWRHVCLLLLLGNAVGILFGRIETLALAKVSTPADIGLYALALRFAQLVTFPGFAIGGGLDPAIAHFHALNDRPALSRRILMATRVMTGAALGLAAAISFSSWLIFPLIDPGFTKAAPIVAILSFGFVMQLAAGRPFPIMTIFGHQREAAWICMLAAVVGVILVFALSARYGAYGAAIATMLVFSLTPAVLAFTLYRLSGLRSDIFAKMER